MDVQVGDRVQRVAGAARPADPRSADRDGRGPHGELCLQIGWRWIPDPDDTDAPAPHRGRARTEGGSDQGPSRGRA